MPASELFDAIGTGDLAALERALAGATQQSLRERDERGLSPLMAALYLRRFELAERLTAASADIDVFEAAAWGDVERVRALTAADPALVQAFAPDGMGALHLACYFRRADVAALLVARGADVDATSRNPLRLRPLHAAVASRQREIVALLLAHGAEVDAAQHGGWTALHAAAKHGDLPLVRLLLEHGADVRRAADDGQTAADLLPAEADPALAELLAARG